VVEPLRPAQVVDQEVRARSERGERRETSGAAQHRAAGGVGAGGEQGRAGREAAGEQVRAMSCFHTGALTIGRP
jgi:hypothetical protein